MLVALKPAETGLLVIDVQDKFVRIMDQRILALVEEKIIKLIAIARALQMPTVVTEQYPKGLGPTVPNVQAALAEYRPLAKMMFSACAEASIADAIRSTGRRHWIVCGLETHICVFQTSRDLLAAGFGVTVARDAVISRERENYRSGLALADKAGAVLATTEGIAFDLMARSGTPEFKQIQPLFK
jgi:nicotinamidase-related amidase